MNEETQKINNRREPRTSPHRRKGNEHELRRTSTKYALVVVVLRWLGSKRNNNHGIGLNSKLRSTVV